MHCKISPGPSLPKRGNFPPFGKACLREAASAKAGEVRRDFIKQCRHYYETVNIVHAIEMLSVG
jgi:hypothetical protein